VLAGSPPRAWGRPVVGDGLRLAARFTPTRVGTTTAHLTSGLTSPVHPHARGDDTSSAGIWAKASGSPPRAWGRRARSPSSYGPLRFTPTRVGTTSPGRRARSPCAVHPHARGDDDRVIRELARLGGSPPRAWGRLRKAKGLTQRERFTPTRVGTTRPRSSSSPLSPVHPHARGDDVSLWGLPIEEAGSPPRAWGRRPAHSRAAAVHRFTPTRVGTTSPPGTAPPSATVHPHARGDDIATGNRATFSDGSPPRAWGRPEDRLLDVEDQRFTPTRVGTTKKTCPRDGNRSVHPHARGDDSNNRTPKPACTRFTPTRVGTTAEEEAEESKPPVHPHARGDDGTVAVRVVSGAGSPPRAWGRPLRGRAASPHGRFTPTRVGTTAVSESTPRSRSVHPHARGDDGDGHMIRDAACGSPPRAWGRRQHSRRRKMYRRFTPTRVGTTRMPRYVLAYRAVHPHARGDDQRAYPWSWARPGSPPRAWGRREGVSAGYRPLRFTPTRVGTTTMPDGGYSIGSVHPHARGDDYHSARSSVRFCGSPPRAWGRR